MISAILRPYIPASWFHPVGILKVLGRLTPRLPDVAGMLFLTFTVNPTLFESPESAFEQARARLRRLFYRLRKGVVWERKTYVINAPYAVKVEFHRDGRAHFHVIFLTRRYLPGPLLTELWGLGRTNVGRISDQKFRYLLKYVTKGGGLPDWVQSRSRLRVFQTSRGFYVVPTGAEEEKKGGNGAKRKTDPRKTTIGERTKRWRRTGLLKREEHFQAFLLRDSYNALLAELVFPIAQEGRYLGNGYILINDITQLVPWLTKLNEST